MRWNLQRKILDNQKTFASSSVMLKKRKILQYRGDKNDKKVFPLSRRQTQKRLGGGGRGFARKIHFKRQLG